MQPPLSPSLQARRARWAISAIFLVFGALFGAWLPYIPEAKRHIGADEAALGQALLFSGIGAVITMQKVGALIHRFGSRMVSVFGALGACCLLPFLLTQQTWLGLSLNLLALGLFYGALDVAMNSHSLEVQALYPRSILASVHGWFSAGGIFGGLGSSLAVSVGVSAQTHLTGTAVAMALLTLAAAPFLLPGSTDQGAEGPRFVWPRGIYLLLGGLCAAAFVVEEGILSWSAVHVREGLRADPVFAGIVTGASSGAMAAGRFLGDFVLTALGERKTVMWGGAASAVGVVGAALSPTVWGSVLCFALACLGLANVVPALFKVAGSIPGAAKSAGLAAVTTCGYVGFLMGPPVIGLVARQSSLPLALCGLAILGMLLVWGGFSMNVQRQNPTAP
jgi:MFS family permease